MRSSNKDNSPNGVLGTVIILAVMLVLFALVFVWMYKVDLLFLPDFVEEFLGLSDDDYTADWSIDELQSAVKAGKDEEGNTVTFEVTPANLKKAFLETPVADGEYVEAQITYFTGENSVKRKVCFFRHGDRFRSELYGFAEPDEPAEIIIGDGKSVNRIHRDSGYVTTSAFTEDVGFEDESGIPRLDTVIELVEDYDAAGDGYFESEKEDGNVSAAAETDAVLPDIDGLELKLLKTDSGNVYYISFQYTRLGISEEYYLSLDNRTVLYMQSKKDGEVYYTYEAKRISHDSELYSQESLYIVSKAAKQ